MSKLPIISKDLKVFPISFTREGKISWYEVDTTKSIDDEEIEAFLKDNQQISTSVYEQLSKDLQDYYTPKETTLLDSNRYNGRALTERNLTSIIRKLTDIDCYVVDYLIETQQDDSSINYTDTSYIEFILDGRYFNLSLQNIDPGNLWAGIHLKNKDQQFEMLDIVDYSDGVGDDAKIYLSGGVTFSNDKLYTSDTKPEGSNDIIYDYVLELIDTNGNVPIESIFRFDKNVIKNISGGTV